MSACSAMSSCHGRSALARPAAPYRRNSIRVHRGWRCAAASGSQQQQEAPSPPTPMSTPSSAAAQQPAAPAQGLAGRLLAAAGPGEGGQQLLLLAAALAGAAALAAAEPGSALAAGEPAAHASHQLLGELAEGDTGFWANVLRYISYFFSVLLGTAYVALKPLVDLFRRPTTAILAVGGIVGLAAFVNFTVQAMLGVTDAGFDYTP